MRAIARAAVAALLVLCAHAITQAATYTDKQVPFQQDGAKKELKSLTGLRGLRYMEFFLVGSEPVNGNFMGTCCMATIASRLKLPAAWKYRTATLDQKLLLIPASGVARILTDNLSNVYDVTGKGYSNFKP